ncbi:MAG: 2-oxoacid:acceptor oxidoreductase family protein [Candidatus Omnitrophota bacterium]
MTEKIIIAGAGGQGVMLLGKVIAQAAMKQDKYVTWLPCYGAEVRGGTAYCMVVVSDEEIGSPCVDKADTLIIMNSPSFDKFKLRIKENGLLIVNSSLVQQKIETKNQNIQCPFYDIAAELGNIKIANMVALGCYIAKKNIIDKQVVLETLDQIAPKDKRDLIEINNQAINSGIDFINNDVQKERKK